MISIYFYHRTLTPLNVRLAWHRMLIVPRVGDRISGPFGEWRVVEVRWIGDTNDEFACVEAHVEDWEQ